MSVVPIRIVQCTTGALHRRVSPEIVFLILKAFLLFLWVILFQRTNSVYLSHQISEQYKITIRTYRISPVLHWRKSTAHEVKGESSTVHRNSHVDNSGAKLCCTARALQYKKCIWGIYKTASLGVWELYILDCPAMWTSIGHLESLIHILEHTFFPFDFRSSLFLPSPSIPPPPRAWEFCLILLRIGVRNESNISPNWFIVQS